MYSSLDKAKDWIKRIHKDPFCFAGHVTGFVIFSYGVWLHNWSVMISGIVVTFILSLPALFGYDTRKTVEVIIRSRFNAAGLVVQLIGYFLAIYSLWIHSWLYFAVGIVIVVAACLFSGRKDKAKKDL